MISSPRVRKHHFFLISYSHQNNADYYISKVKKINKLNMKTNQQQKNSIQNTQKIPIF